MQNKNDETYVRTLVGVVGKILIRWGFLAIRFHFWNRWVKADVLDSFRGALCAKNITILQKWYFWHIILCISIHIIRHLICNIVLCTFIGFLVFLVVYSLCVILCIGIHIISNIVLCTFFGFLAFLVVCSLCIILCISIHIIRLLISNIVLCTFCGFLAF